MTERRWTDPRNRRTWEITATWAVRSGPEVPDDLRILCFDSVATPRRGHAVRCCPGIERRIPQMDDQSLALCLEAAAGGGFLFCDERDGELWWARRRIDPERGPQLVLSSRTREVRVPSAAPQRVNDGRHDFPPVDTLLAALDGTETATAA